MNQSKPWYLSRTLLFSILTGLVGVITVLEGMYPGTGILVTVGSIINFLLRLDTSLSIQ